VKQDTKKALHYFALSAKQGYGLASARIGEFHWRGEMGCEKNMRRALELYQVAAQSGDPNALTEAEKFFVSLATAAPFADSK